MQQAVVLPKILYEFSKKDLQAFLLSFANEKGSRVFIPVKRDITRFELMNNKNINEISFQENSLFPIKEHFFSKREKIFEFDATEIKPTIPPAEKKTFFGLRRCDLAAITHQDKAFLEGNFKDPYYAARRKETTLIGYHCPTAPSQYCFCGSLNLELEFDLMFYESDDPQKFRVEVGSEKGKGIIENHKDKFKETQGKADGIDKKIPNSDRLHTLNLKPLYDNPDWKRGVDMCLSCGACTSICPTCYCFEFKDEVKMANPKEGERVREWSSCQLPEFTKVAGGHTFRQKRDERFKHRIYHQLDYFKDRMGVTLCTGCGRCIEGCPTRIDFVDIINKMKK